MTSTAITPIFSGDQIDVRSSSYHWSMSTSSATFELRDSRARRIAHGNLHPAVRVTMSDSGDEMETAGALADASLVGESLRLTFSGLNGDGTAEVTYTFFPDYVRVEPVAYSSPTPSHVESMLLFAQWGEYGAQPAWWSQFYLHPGSTESSAVSPVIPAKIRMSMVSTIGRGSTDETAFAQQQWALPLYFWGAYGVEGWGSEKGALTQNLSDVVVTGLTELPTGDIHIKYFGEYSSPYLRVFGNRWNTHDPSRGTVSLGAPFVWAFGEGHREAIRAYYAVLASTGVIKPRLDSAKKSMIVTMSQFNTWGAQVANGWASGDLDQTSLETIYDQFSSSGMDAEMFVIDDRWEGPYGRLEHDTVRFPDFEQFLDRIREDGHAVGMWAAFIRCQDPNSMGLTLDDMLQDPSGNPVTRSLFDDHYYLFDVSRPKVRDVLQERARAYMRRYKPDLVKFDFGYELPSMKYAAPADRSWGGELILLKSLEVVIEAMREVNPDIAVMYYNLSPLLGAYVDQHSTDDLYLNAGEYGAEVNRRIFFSSLLAEYGMPTYGSGGYDWIEVREIWFDTVASGPLGSLNSFTGDQVDSSPSEQDFARYRGLSRLTRRTTSPARIEVVEGKAHSGSLTDRARSWARWEGDQLTVAALRTRPVEGVYVPVDYSGISTTAQVVLASLSAQGISDSEHLGIVACGPGVLSFPTTQRGAPSAFAHVRGESNPIDARRESDRIVIDVDSVWQGAPIDWIELKF